MHSGDFDRIVLRSLVVLCSAAYTVCRHIIIFRTARYCAAHFQRTGGEGKGSMESRKRWIAIVCFAVLAMALFIGTIVVKSPGGHGAIGDLMKDAVLHELNKVSLFGLLDVNPGLISAMAVTGIFFLFALAVRIFVIPKFTMIPGRFQLLLETAVGLFDDLAKSNSPHRNQFLGAYLFVAGAYIFVGTIFELFGFQVITTHGTSMSLPAPLADINGAIMMGCLS